MQGQAVIAIHTINSPTSENMVNYQSSPQIMYNYVLMTLTQVTIGSLCLASTPFDNHSPPNADDHTLRSKRQIVTIQCKYIHQIYPEQYHLTPSLSSGMSFIISVSVSTTLESIDWRNMYTTYGTSLYGKANYLKLVMDLAEVIILT